MNVVLNGDVSSSFHGGHSQVYPYTYVFFYFSINDILNDISSQLGDYADDTKI